MADRPTLWLVSGPTSAGKTRLINSPRIRELTGLGEDAPVLHPNDLTRKLRLSRDTVLHYNLLRPAQRSVQKGGQPVHDFGIDRKLGQALALDAERRALILVASKAKLTERSGQRIENEPGSGNDYGRTKWLDLYERVDLDELYGAWRDELRRLQIPWVELDSESQSFPEIGSNR